MKGTSALEIHCSAASSQQASVYSIGVHASSAMALIAALTWEVILTVTETSAPARTAAPMVGWP